MVPTGAEAAEIAQARAQRRGALVQAAADGYAPSHVKVGVAVETPSLVWQANTALRRVDFATVGTNDLLQFTFGADRDGVRMAERYDALSPPALTMLRHLARAAEKANTPLAVCGNMASDPLAAMALIGLGLRALSVVPPAVKPIRELAAQLDAGEVSRLIDDLIESEEHSIRDQFRDFAESKGISVDDNY